MKSKLLFTGLGSLFGVGICLFYLIISSPDTVTNKAVSILNPVSIEDVFCQIDDFTQANSQVEVPIKIQAGMSTVQIPPLVVAVDGVQASVIYEQGNQYESQKYLSFILRHGSSSAVSSTMYDYTPVWQPGPINVIYFEENNKTIRLQCAFRESE